MPDASAMVDRGRLPGSRGTGSLGFEGIGDVSGRTMGGKSREGSSGSFPDVMEILTSRKIEVL
jgi:hypothetical protein